MSEKKKILIFIDWFLPGYKAGGPIRSVANMIDHLHEYYNFKIITSDRDYLETEGFSDIETDKWLNFENKAKIIYLSPETLNKNNLKKIIRNSDFDIAYINGIYSYYFSILPLRLLNSFQKKIIIAPRGMLSKQAFSAKQAKKKVFLTIAKHLGLYKNIIFQATHKNEIIDIKKIISKKANVLYIPNLPRKVTNLKTEKIHKEKGKLKLVSIARISPEKNTLYALKILSSKSFTGTIQFDLYGSIYNNEYWKECEQIIKDLPENINVNYKNEISTHNVAETFSEYHFAFMPSLGENFGHSILESMAAGRPVIISDQTPWRKLKEKSIGWDISLNNDSGFADAIQTCINLEQDNYNSMSENAFRFAKEFALNEETNKQYTSLFSS